MGPPAPFWPHDVAARCRPRTEARGRRRDGHSGGLTPDGPLRKHYSCVLARSPAWCGGTVRRSRMAGVAVEDALELWASSLREVKRGMRPLFTQERVAALAGLFLDGLLGPERRKTGWMRAEAAGDPGPWRQQAILGRGRWETDA